MTTYAIKDWNEVFETNITRRLSSLRYVAFPTRQDSSAFVQLMRSANGIIAYGLFMALVQIAARCPRRGVLEDDRGDWTPARIAKRYGTPIKVVQGAIEMLTSAEIGWLVNVESARVESTQDVRDARAERAQGVHDARAERAQGAVVVRSHGGGLEGIGLEGTGLEGTGVHTPRASERASWRGGEGAGERGSERGGRAELDNVPGAIPMPGDVPEFKPIADAHPKPAGWRKSVDAMRAVWASVYEHHGGTGSETERIKRGLAWMMGITLAYAKAVRGEETRFLPACDRFWGEGIYETPAAWSSGNGHSGREHDGQGRPHAGGNRGGASSGTAAAYVPGHGKLGLDAAAKLALILSKNRGAEREEPSARTLDESQRAAAPHGETNSVDHLRRHAGS